MAEKEVEGSNNMNREDLNVEKYTVAQFLAEVDQVYIIKVCFCFASISVPIIYHLFDGMKDKTLDFMCVFFN